MQRNKRDVEHALTSKGFEQDECHHHMFFYRSIQGQLTAIRTRTSHSGKTLDDYLIGQMAKQCRLGRHDFLHLIDCPLSRAGYEELVTASLGDQGQSAAGSQ